MPEISVFDGFEKLTGTIETFIHGNTEVVRLALVCLFAEGHLLIEGVPGVAKTSLAKAIARSISKDGDKRAQFKRIQFTPDLLPSDVTGASIFLQDSGRFRFDPGPVFTNILLADEINRASPRTQSALLEVMAERQVTVDGETYEVPRPFMCIATQNPVEHRGTFPLPEAQIDRFMMKVTMKPPGRAEELKVLYDGLQRLTPETAVGQEMDIAQVGQMIQQVRNVLVKPVVQHYIVDIVAATRTAALEESPDIVAGVSPRAGIALALAAQAYAASDGRTWAGPDDVKAVAYPVLRHRLVLSRSAADRRMDPDTVIRNLLGGVTAPSKAEAALET
jgi:MoxR-like ATPase